MKLTKLMTIVVAGLVAGGVSQVNAAAFAQSKNSNYAKVVMKHKAKSNFKHHEESKMVIKNKAKNTVKSNEKINMIETKKTHKLVR